LHRISGSVQALSQHTPLAQKPVPHCDGVVQAPPCGTGLAVGVAVTVAVGVFEGTGVPSIVVQSPGKTEQGKAELETASPQPEGHSMSKQS